MCYSCWIWCYFSRSWRAQRKPPWNRNHMGTFLHQNLIFPAERGRKGEKREERADRLQQMTSVDAQGPCFLVHKFCVDLQQQAGQRRLIYWSSLQVAMKTGLKRQCGSSSPWPWAKCGGRHSNNGYSVSLKSNRHIYLAGRQSIKMIMLFIYLSWCSRYVSGPTDLNVYSGTLS